MSVQPPVDRAHKLVEIPGLTPRLNLHVLKEVGDTAVSRQVINDVLCTRELQLSWPPLY